MEEKKEKELNTEEMENVSGGLPAGLPAGVVYDFERNRETIKKLGIDIDEYIKPYPGDGNGGE